jgi:hypothetical protein
VSERSAGHSSSPRGVDYFQWLVREGKAREGLVVLQPSLGAEGNASNEASRVQQEGVRLCC